MVVGAAYGPGVYLGKSFGVAAPYSAIQPQPGLAVGGGAAAAAAGAGAGRMRQYAAVAVVSATPGPALREIPYPGGAYACTAAPAMELTHLVLF